MSKLRKKFLVPDPVTYARAAVATIGIQRVTLGCVEHALQVSGSPLHGHMATFLLVELCN